MVLLNRLLKKVSLNRWTFPHAPYSNEKLQIAVRTETNDPLKELLRMCYYMSYNFYLWDWKDLLLKSGCQILQAASEIWTHCFGSPVQSNCRKITARMFGLHKCKMENSSSVFLIPKPNIQKSQKSIFCVSILHSSASQAILASFRHRGKTSKLVHHPSVDHLRLRLMYFHLMNCVLNGFQLWCLEFMILNVNAL